jgi:hypothetical protein
MVGNMVARDMMTQCVHNHTVGSIDGFHSAFAKRPCLVVIGDGIIIVVL